MSITREPVDWGGGGGHEPQCNPYSNVGKSTEHKELMERVGHNVVCNMLLIFERASSSVVWSVGSGLVPCGVSVQPVDLYEHLPFILYCMSSLYYSVY